MRHGGVMHVSCDVRDWGACNKRYLVEDMSGLSLTWERQGMVTPVTGVMHESWILYKYLNIYTTTRASFGGAVFCRIRYGFFRIGGILNMGYHQIVETAHVCMCRFLSFALMFHV